MSESFRFDVRVYYEDTDLSGVVYHAAYLHFFERGRTEFLRALGVHHHELIADGVAFAVRSMQIEFIAPARIDDLLSVETRVLSASGARLRLVQRIFRGETELTTAEVTVVAITTTGRPVRLPKAVLAHFAA